MKRAPDRNNRTPDRMHGALDKYIRHKRILGRQEDTRENKRIFGRRKGY